MKKTLKALVCAVLILAAVFGLAACAAEKRQEEEAPPAQTGVPSVTVVQESADSNTVTVSASSVVTIVPDRATVTFGVTTEAETAEEAQLKNNQAVDKVISALKGRGVDDKSIRTSYYSLSPRYDWSENKEKIIGYSVYTTLTVKDREIPELGGLVSACVEAGANRVDSLSFLCSGYDEAYARALSQAVEAARAKAEVLAQAAGLTCYEALTISEGWQDTSSRYSKATNAAAEMAADGAMPNFQPGETEITANVTVTFRLG